MTDKQKNLLADLRVRLVAIQNENQKDRP